MENYIIPFSGLCFVVLLFLVFRKHKKIKYPIAPEEKFIGSIYIPDMEGKKK
jgi:hypothetical protein